MGNICLSGMKIHQVFDETIGREMYPIFHSNNTFLISVYSTSTCVQYILQPVYSSSESVYDPSRKLCTTHPAVYDISSKLCMTEFRSVGISIGYWSWCYFLFTYKSTLINYYNNNSNNTNNNKNVIIKSKKLLFAWIINFI